MNEIIIKVNGMMCIGCEKRVQNAIKNVEGVENVVANHKEATVKIIASSKASRNVIEEKIEDIGFEVVKED